jgi:thiol:disulfide interchange protein DsbD
VFRAGEPAELAFAIDVPKGWHIYAPEPGDAGLPTRVTLSLPVAWEAGPPRFPEARRFDEPGGIVTFGYTGDVAVSVPIRLGSGSVAGPAAVGAEVRWLACRERCVPGSAQLAARVPVESASQSAEGSAGTPGGGDSP